MQKMTSITYKENTSYGYASGRLRVLETRLLNKASIGRLLEADSTQEVLRILSEGEYAVALSEISNPSDFEKALEIEMERTYALVDELSHDPDLTKIFRTKWDFHNLKVLLKSSYLKELAPKTDDILAKFGTVPIEDIKLAIEPDAEKKGNILPDYLMTALVDVRSKYEASQDPQIIDIIVDNHLHNFLYNTVKYKNPFLKGYFEAVADLINIKNFIRIKNLGGSIKMLDAVLLPHGTLDKKLFLQQYEETIENFVGDLVATVLVKTPYVSLVAEAIRGWEEDHSLATFEKLTDNYLINYIKPAQYIVFGVEPLIAYLLAKEHEIKLIRIIITGKINDLPIEIINERLRDTYA
ncbi:MAG: V-type synthase subunit [Candidatus Poribacteria bacterium]|nr:V-type synthase subunit [Candidatus Poribacteria bacterium]